MDSGLTAVMSQMSLINLIERGGGGGGEAFSHPDLLRTLHLPI